MRSKDLSDQEGKRRKRETIETGQEEIEIMELLSTALRITLLHMFTELLKKDKECWPAAELKIWEVYVLKN